MQLTNRLYFSGLDINPRPKLHYYNNRLVPPVPQPVLAGDQLEIKPKGISVETGDINELRKQHPRKHLKAPNPDATLTNTSPQTKSPTQDKNMPEEADKDDFSDLELEYSAPLERFKK